jgi:thiamine biosynthesis lipoprotein
VSALTYVAVPCAVLAAAAVSPCLGQEAGGVSRCSFESEHMGTTFRIVAYAQSEAEARSAAAEAFGHVARLDSLFSDYRPDSEIARLAHHAGSGRFEPVSEELWAILIEASRWSERSQGAFDVTVGPLSRLWRWSARRGELPDPVRVRTAREAVGFESLVVDAVEPRVKLARPDMSLDLGGIAKGFAADAALAILARHGIRAALVDGGGDIAVGAPPPDAAGWLVALPDGDSLRLAHAAVATSGDDERHVVVDGVRYAHVVDPRTGLGVVDAPTVTVVAMTATAADALASALTAMDAASGRALVDGLGGAWARVHGRDRWNAGVLPSWTEHSDGRRTSSPMSEKR